MTSGFKRASILLIKTLFVTLIVTGIWVGVVLLGLLWAKFTVPQMLFIWLLIVVGALTIRSE